MTIFFNILQPPDSIHAQTGTASLPLHASGEGWTAGDISVETRLQDGALAVTVGAETSLLERIHLRWAMPVPAGLRFLGDAWERAYGDLEWRGLVPERIMPWYFLAYEGSASEGAAKYGATHGYGVKTGPGALCFWMVDSGGVNLWLDVRNGGSGVELRGRRLLAAEVVARQGQPGETPFQAARAFCRLLCPAPRLPSQPVYGSNNWYYAYGNSTHQAILEDTRLLVELAPASENRPYMVIDAGWQPLSGDERSTQTIIGGPYTSSSGAYTGSSGAYTGSSGAYTGPSGPLSNPRFPDMAVLASGIRSLGARPGIWIRPLAAYPDDPDSLLLPVSRASDASAKIKVMDPSIPEVLARISADFASLRAWGYDLIKHDWATCDLLGRWGFQMGAALTNPGWHFADRTRTTAEINLGLFRAIRAGAGDAVVIGCNTIGHLSAGLFEMQRTGDDTSGMEWERSRKYGVNAQAFRGCQHGAFFAADPDCVGDTRLIPWEKNRQLLDLFARSGTVLFISIDPASLSPEETGDIRRAYAQAAAPQPLAEPLDWLDGTAPAQWKLGDETVRYDWYNPEGVQPFSQSIPLWWG